MNTGEARPIQKRRAADLSRKISAIAFNLIFGAIVTESGGERINQEGRILGPAPVVATPTLFNTPQADAIVSAMQIFPVTNHVREKNETATMSLSSGSGYKIPKRGAKATLTILNAP